MPILISASSIPVAIAIIRLMTSDQRVAQGRVYIESAKTIKTYILTFLAGTAIITKMKMDRFLSDIEINYR